MSDWRAEFTAALHLDDAPSGDRTIREVLRELGREAVTRGDEHGLELILEAYRIAEKMTRALLDYRADSVEDGEVADG